MRYTLTIDGENHTFATEALWRFGVALPFLLLFIINIAFQPSPQIGNVSKAPYFKMRVATPLTCRPIPQCCHLLSKRRQLLALWLRHPRSSETPRDDIGHQISELNSGTIRPAR